MMHSNWQPIEAAPKDGEDALLHRTLGRPPIVGGFFDGEWKSFDRPNKAIIGVRHWMPLPLAPEASHESR